MSGHSKWAKIKHAKGAKDAKRGALFTTLAKAITMTAQEGGGDPDMNFSLRLAIDKAKQANMPKDNIARAIKKGTGELKGEAVLQRITYEFVSSIAGVSGLIDCTTDNTNRTVSDVKNLVETSGHKMAEAGGVSWGFKEQGEVVVASAKLKKTEKYGEDDSYIPVSIDDLEGALLEINGVIDYEIEEDDADNDARPVDRKYVSILTSKEDLVGVTKTLKDLEWQIVEGDIVKVADNKVKLDDADEAKLGGFIEQLLDHDDIDNVWTNVE